MFLARRPSPERIDRFLGTLTNHAEAGEEPTSLSHRDEARDTPQRCSQLNFFLVSTVFPCANLQEST